MKRLILTALLTALLAGCTSQGFTQASTRYPQSVQGCIQATQQWLSNPQDKGLLSKALADCDRALAAGKGQAEVEKRASYSDLQQLQMSLSTALTLMDQGGDPRTVETTTGIIPVESVKIVKAMLENDLSNEARSASPAPQ